MEIFLIIMVIAVGIIAAVFANKAHQARLLALLNWATANEWSYHEGKRSDPNHPFPLFNTGLRRYSQFHATRTFADAAPGLDPATSNLCEYHYAERRSDGKRTYYQHYHFTCCIVSINADLGQIALRDENFADKLFQSIGFDDIDLEDPNFSKKFVLKAKDRKDAYDLFDANLMDFMVRHAGWTIETRGPLMLVYKPGKVSPEAYNAIATFALGFLAHLPRLLVNTQRAKQNLPPLIEGGSVATRYAKNNSPSYNPNQAQEH